MFRLSRHKQSVFTGTPVARNDRIALNYFDEANSKPLNLTAKRVFFLKNRSLSIYSKAGE